MSRRIRLAAILIVGLVVVVIGIVLLLNQQPANERVSVRVPPDTSHSIQVVLEPADCSGSSIPNQLDSTRYIIAKRLNELEIVGALVEIYRDCQIRIELPATDNPEQALDVVLRTGSLEFVDAHADPYSDGTVIRTTGNPSPTVSITASLQLTIPDKVYTTILSGTDFKPDELRVSLGGPERNQVEVVFTLTDAAAQKLKQFTTEHNETANKGKPYYVCIVLDNVAVSCPTIRSPIPDGRGVITVGSGGLDEASRLLNLLRYGALPLRLHIVEIKR